MAGLYVHIPFCKSKCSYCDFCSIATSGLVPDFIEAITSEISFQSKHYNKQIFDTLYFGGGTPSLLKIEELEKILNTIFLHFKFSKDCEISFEANPDDLTLDYLVQLKQLSINRLSVGIQSTDDNVLKMMRRRHSADQGVTSVINAQEAGFKNISVDIIYGIDGLSTAQLESQLKRMLSLPVSHLSAYHLGIEEGTLLNRQLKEGKIKKIAEEQSFSQYLTLIRSASENGFDQYEISNFTKGANISKHNSSYWNRTPYLGLGPSAHSFNGFERFYNTSDVKKYISEGKKSIFSFQTETLTKTDILNETIMLGLRTSRGIDLDKFLADFGSEEYNNLLVKTGFINCDFYVISDNRLWLTHAGMFVSDSICTNLFK